MECSKLHGGPGQDSQHEASAGETRQSLMAGGPEERAEVSWFNRCASVEEAAGSHRQPPEARGAWQLWAVAGAGYRREIGPRQPRPHRGL